MTLNPTVTLNFQLEGHHEDIKWVQDSDFTHKKTLLIFVGKKSLKAADAWSSCEGYREQEVVRLVAVIGTSCNLSDPKPDVDGHDQLNMYLTANGPESQKTLR